MSAHRPAGAARLASIHDDDSYRAVPVNLAAVRPGGKIVRAKRSRTIHTGGGGGIDLGRRCPRCGKTFAKASATRQHWAAKHQVKR